jgi:hypothetical protein
MSTSLPIRYKAEPIRTIAAGSIMAGYIRVGTALVFPCRQFKIDNLTDALLMFSIDGINDHFVVPSNGFFLSDIMSNEGEGEGFFLSARDSLWVRILGTPTTGNVYFSVFYGYPSLL